MSLITNLGINWQIVDEQKEKKKKRVIYSVTVNVEVFSSFVLTFE